MKPHCDVPLRFRDDRPVFCGKEIVASKFLRVPVTGRPSGQPRYVKVAWYACAEHRADVMSNYTALTTPHTR